MPTTLRHYDEVINSVAFSPDGKTVLTGSTDRTARLWDIASGKLLATLEYIVGKVRCLAFSPDGKTVLIGSNSKAARLWDIARGKVLTELRSQRGQVTSVAFSPDGSRQCLLVLPIELLGFGRQRAGRGVDYLIGHTLAVTSVAFSPDGKTVLTGSADGTARLWEATQKPMLAVSDDQIDTVTSVAFSPDGKTVLTGSTDGTARLWETASGQMPTTLRRYDGGSNQRSIFA